VSLRIISLILLTITMMSTAGAAAHRAGAGGAQAPTCNAADSLRTLTLPVPANRAVTFPLLELLPEADPFALVTETALALARPDGSLHFATANSTAEAEAHLTPSGLTFAPHHGFTGASSGWLLTVPVYRDDTPLSRLSCAGMDLANRPMTAVLVTFEVRNDLPQAFDDQVAVPNVATLMDVGPEAGVLANDVDVNGDPLVVHAAGTTAFPWGSVDLAADGSYRVVITDRELLQPATVRYLVWDQQGSPTSVDTGYLDIDFTAE
jgi:hypothetical protein